MSKAGYIQAKVGPDEELILRMLAEHEENSIARVAGRILREGLERLQRENQWLMKRRAEAAKK